MKMKYIALLAGLLSSAILTGCGQSDYEKEQARKQQLERLDRGYDKHCNRKIVRAPHISPIGNVRVEYDMNNVVYAPAMPGTYVNYYGDPRYGYWTVFGNFKFYDPYSTYATNTNSFLLGAGLGALAGYSLTRSQWDTRNPSGWKSSSRSNTKYISNNGKTITKAEANKRKQQSQRDKAKHRKSFKAKQTTAAKKQTTSKTSTSKKPATKMSTSDVNKRKAELKAKANKRALEKKTNKPASKFNTQKKTTSFSKSSSYSKTKAPTKTVKRTTYKKPTSYKPRNTSYKSSSSSSSSRSKTVKRR